MGRRLKAFLKVAFSAGLILFLLTRLDRAELLQQLASAQPAWLLIALALYCAAILLGVVKWQVLVRVQQLQVSYGDLTAFTFTGLFVGNILPTNVGGDVVRALALAQAVRGSHEPAVMSVVMDRLLGLAAFCGAALVSAVAALFWLTRSPQLEAVEFAAVAMLTGIVLVSAGLAFSRRVARAFGLILDRTWLAKFRPAASRLYHAIHIYRGSTGAMLVNVLLSGATLVAATLAWYATARALGLDIPLLYFFLFNPLVTVVLLIPISFNGLGTKEATTVFFFGLIGVPSESAFALSLLFHAIIVVSSLPGGILMLRSRPALEPTAVQVSAAGRDRTRP